jgi:RNA polymerase sigma-70 factor (ECF subfamily)
MDDLEAIRRLQAGDIGGLEHLVRRYQGEALEAAVLIGRDYALAEDVVQTVFLRVYERIDQFDTGRPLGPWLLRSVVNETLRAVGRRPVSLDAAGLPMHASASGEPGPEEALAAAETRAAVWAAIERLTPEQRAVVVLRYYGGLRHVEIARRLVVPAGTVRRRLHDAHHRLRRLLPTWLVADAGRQREGVSDDG